MIGAMVTKTTDPIPNPGQIVRVRTRTYLVEAVEENGSGPQTVVNLACLDDDAQGEKLDIVWGLELDTEILDKEAWKSLENDLEKAGKQFFDNLMAAFSKSRERGL